MKNKVLVLVCTSLLGTGLAFAQTDKLNRNNQVEKIKVIKSKEHSKEVKSVEKKVEKIKNHDLELKRKSTLKEATEALNDTRNVLKYLDENKKDEALSLLGTIIGKLEIILARNPELKLLPVNIEEQVFDLHVGKEGIKILIEEVKETLNNGEIQLAKKLIQNLSHEIVIRTTSIPLETYPNAIKAIVPEIDAGEINRAKAMLVSVLNTLVVEDEIIPLSTLRASLILKKAEKLVENHERTKEDRDKLKKLLAVAREQLEITGLLGYGDKNSLKEIYKQIDLIESKTKDNKGGKGWFDILKEKILNLNN